VNCEVKKAGGYLYAAIHKENQMASGELFSQRPKVSFSHVEEDLVLRHIVQNFAIDKRISWLDIGASYPVFGNNFFALSLKLLPQGRKKSGIKISIDPRPNLGWRYKFLQPRTKFINAMVSVKEKHFFLNTLDLENSSSILTYAQGLGDTPEWYKEYIVETVPRIIQIRDLQKEFTAIFGVRNV